MVSALVRCSASQRANAVVRQCVYGTHCTTCTRNEVENRQRATHSNRKAVRR
jgi:hypothetical protein